MIYASGSKFFRFGPATRPTRPKRTKEPIPKPAAHGLKPPKAKEANKFMILKHNIFELASVSYTHLTLPTSDLV